MAASDNENAHHLCVLIHGLWGNPGHLENMAKALREKHPQESLHILIAERNTGNFTYDGVEVCGERVCNEIEEELEKLARDGRDVKKISLIGYSLGGVVARYAVGLLDSKGVFDRIEPLNFQTFASPHLGVRTPLHGWHSQAWNAIGARVLSASGQQLFTTDKFRDTGRPLFEVMADPDSIFMKGLAKFKRRTLYYNIINDRTAVYYTTAISSTDPFENLDKISFKYLKGYEDVIIDSKVPVTHKLAENPAPGPLKVFGRKVQSTASQLPTVAAISLILPIAAVIFLTASSVESLRSQRRIKLYEKGLAGVEFSSYRGPLLSGMRGVVDGAYETLNSAREPDHLDAGAGSSSSSTDVLSKTSLDTDEKAGREFHAPTLALAPCQFKMIESINKVGWRKYPVHIQRVSHSHAAIIVRFNRSGFAEGKVVLRHWLEEEFLP